MNIESMSVGQITEYVRQVYACLSDENIKNKNYPEFELLLHRLDADPRKGVQKVSSTYKAALKKELNEILRVEALINFDKSYGVPVLAGVDEVGRGPLAGPVVAGCVIMDLSKPIKGIDDSKKLSKQKRELLYDEIVKTSRFCSIGEVDAKTIDQVNILNATFLAMNSAIGYIQKELDTAQDRLQLILVDGNQKIRNQDLPQATITKGDSRSYSIACASILAKVYRDRLMEKLDAQYPQYDFASNAGYGSQKHQEAIAQFGLTPIHRRTFCSKFY